MASRRAGRRRDGAIGAGQPGPDIRGTIGAQTIDAGNSVTIDVSSNFRDPDGDRLIYSATTSNASVATATVSGSGVTISAGAGGTATITVTARDPGRLSARQRIRVTVPNGAPAARSIPAQTIARHRQPRSNCRPTSRIRMGIGSATAVRRTTRAWRPRAWSEHPDDPAGGRRRHHGHCDARDQGDLTASEDVAVTVQPRPNRPPSGVAIPAQTLTKGGR